MDATAVSYRPISAMDFALPHAMGLNLGQMAAAALEPVATRHHGSAVGSLVAAAAAPGVPSHGDCHVLVQARAQASDA